MLPSFKPNSYVICFKTSKIDVDDVVVLDIDNFGKVLKRVKTKSNNLITLEGDNKSYDSPVYEESYDISETLGKVIFKF